MDRWQLSVTRNSKLPATEEKGEDQLPRSANVVNNYFSLGVDAQIALQFHEAREANPQKFNSRIRNKMYYGQAGGKVVDICVLHYSKLANEMNKIRNEKLPLSLNIMLIFSRIFYCESGKICQI